MYPDRHKWSINNTCTSLLSRWTVTLTNELQLGILQNRERERSEKGDKGEKGEKGEKVASDIHTTNLDQRRCGFRSRLVPPS